MSCKRAYISTTLQKVSHHCNILSLIKLVHVLLEFSANMESSFSFLYQISFGCQFLTIKGINYNAIAICIYFILEIKLEIVICLDHYQHPFYMPNEQKLLAILCHVPTTLHYVYTTQTLFFKLMNFLGLLKLPLIYCRMKLTLFKFE